ncbi:MAG TPA: hypothetical protein VL551_13370 [Actinospica sp.]|jgi:hypothetical protein|nr:hypothetical protein [Actinospica sp.]
MDIDPVLAAALAPLLRDLEAGHVTEPRLATDSRFYDADEPAVLLYAPDGSGFGVRVLPDAPYAEQLAHLADQVQEWAVEALWSEGKSAVWPQCPDHPDSHPLQPNVIDEYTQQAAAVWQCPKTRDVVAKIGELRS